MDLSGNKRKQQDYRFLDEIIQGSGVDTTQDLGSSSHVFSL